MSVFKAFHILFAYLVMATTLAGCFSTGIETTKVNGASTATVYNPATQVPIFAYPSTSNAYEVGSMFLLVPTVTYSGDSLSFALTGTLPAGLAFSTTSGIIYGLPTATSATTSFTIVATNSAGTSQEVIIIDLVPDFSYAVATADYELTTPFSLAAPTVVYPATGTLSYTITPTLPAGLSLNGSTGAITGTPTAVKTVSSFIVTLTANGLSTDFALELNDITRPTVAYAATGSYTYNTAMTALSPVVTYLGVGGGYALNAGTLPTGVSLNTTTGAISGTPTASVDSTGAAHIVTVRVTNNKGFRDYNISLSETGVPRVSYPASELNYYREDGAGIQTGLPSSPALASPTITFCKAPCVFSSSDIPGDLTLDPSSGAITSGAIASQLTTSFTVTATGADTFAAAYPFTIVEKCNATGGLFVPQMYGGGSGAETDPWLLCTKDHINEISVRGDADNSHYARSFQLEDDIDMQSLPFTPIGIGPIGEKCFSGNFLGNNHVISNINIENTVMPVHTNTGFFSCLEDFGIVNNFTLFNVYSNNANPKAAALAGLVRIGAANPNGLAQNVVEMVSVYKARLLNDDANSPANPAEGLLGGLIGVVSCPAPGVNTLTMRTTIFHGELEQRGSINSLNSLAGLLITEDASNPLTNCVMLDRNAAFFADMTGDNVSITYGPGTMGSHPRMDVNDFMVFHLDNPNVTATVVVDLAMAYIFTFPEIMMTSSSYDLNDVGTLASSAFWAGMGFIPSPTEYGMLDPNPVTLAPFSAGSPILVPQRLCDIGLATCLP